MSHVSHSHAVLGDHLSDVCQVMYSTVHYNLHCTVRYSDCTVARWLPGTQTGREQEIQLDAPSSPQTHHGTHVSTSPGAIHIKSYHSMGVFAPSNSEGRILLSLCRHH